MALPRQAMNMTPEAILQAIVPVDFININSLLSEEERAIRDRVRAFVDQHVIPVAAEYWDKAQFPFELVPGLGELGIMGGAFKGYGCAGWSSGLAIVSVNGRSRVAYPAARSSAFTPPPPLAAIGRTAPCGLRARSRSQ